MAVYSKLLLSAGGGIVSAHQQAEQASNTASVLIGLGGTGMDCLRTVKTQVYSRLKADDPEAVVPSYAHIRFLGIDSTEKTKGVKGWDEENTADELMELEDTEFFSISNPNVKKAFENKLALEKRAELDWLGWEEIAAPDMTNAGAGGIRQVGRFMMMDKSDLFMSRIEQEINAAKSGLAEPTVNVHIFSGLCGGTGAGCFLDVCYMVRSIAEKVGGVTIFGYFFLPDVNLAKIPMSNTKVRAYIPKNGYASMQELDYCMQLQYNGGSFIQEYQGHKKVEWKAGPVDMCHLVCATNASGDVIPNAYDYAMNVVAEYVMDFLTFSDKAFGLSEQLSNFRQMIRTADGEKVIGSELAYCVIGASSASVPLREINTYLASELFGHFSKIGQNVPARADVERLAILSIARNAQNVTDIYNSLYRELRDGASDDYASYMDDRKFVHEYGNSEMVTHYTNQTASKLNRAEANGKSLLSEENGHSLLKRVQTQLTEVIKDIDRGPIYAYRMISAAESHNMLNIIDGLIEENRSRWNQEAAQSSLRMKDYETAKADFEGKHKRSLFDSDEKRFDDYEFYLKLLEQHKLSEQIYGKMDTVLKTFRKQLVDCTANYYIKLSRVTETLINTFKENKDALASEKMMKPDSSFSIPMMTIEELKKSLDEEIEKINVSGMLDSFMDLMLENEESWILEDENKITKLVTTFFVETAFGGFANRTITSFLKDKYDIDNDERLAGRIYEDWMKVLTAKASPLFYFNGSVWREDQTSKLAFLSIPSTSAPIKAAAQKMYATDSLWETKESTLTDRIYVMCSACALPLSSYNNCEEYERLSFSSQDPGRHYYEGKGMDGALFNDWSKLPSLTPQSMLRLESAPDMMRDMVLEARNLFDKAYELNIFDEQNKICAPDEEAVKNLYALIERCKGAALSMARPEDVAEMTKLVEALDEAEKIPMIRTQYFMRNDGFVERLDTKKSVCKDHFVSAPVYQQVVKEIVRNITSVREEIASAKKMLKLQMDKISKGGRDMSLYCDALFSGVISVEGKMIIYHQSDAGIITDHVLSKRGDGFEFGSIPVYQGFLTYQTLSDELKDEIKRLVDDRINMEDAALRETGLKLKEEFSDDCMNAWAQLAASFETRKEIVEFLGKMKQKFNNFCLEFLR